MGGVRNRTDLDMKIFRGVQRSLKALQQYFKISEEYMEQMMFAEAGQSLAKAFELVVLQ